MSSPGNGLENRRKNEPETGPENGLEIFQKKKKSCFLFTKHHASNFIKFV